MARSRTIRALGALMLGLLLSGCWTQIGFGPEKQRFNPHETSLTAGNVASLQQAWAVALPTEEEPIVSGGRVYVGHGASSSYGVGAFDLATGAALWNYDLVSAAAPGFTLDTAAPVVASGRIWASFAARNPAIGQCGGVEVQLDLADGGAVTREPGRHGAAPVVAGGSIAQVRTVFERSPGCGGETTMLQVTPESGSPWSYPTGDGQSPGMPAIAGQQVLLPLGHQLLSFPLNGCGAPTCAPTWTFEFNNLHATVDTVIHQVVVGPDQIYALVSNPEAQRAVLIAVSREGTFAWNAEVGASDGRLALAGDRLFLATAGSGAAANTLLAFPASGCGHTGCTPAWTASLGGVASLGEGPVVAGDVVYVGRLGSVVAYRASGCEATTCAPIASVEVGGDPRGMSVSDGHLLVTTGSQLVAFAPRPTA